MRRKPSRPQQIQVSPSKTAYIVARWVKSNMFPYDQAIACQGREELDRYFKNGRFRGWDNAVTFLIQCDSQIGGVGHITRGDDSIHAHPMDEKFITAENKSPSRPLYMVAPWVDTNMVPYDQCIVYTSRELLEQEIQFGRFDNWEPQVFVLQYDKIIKCSASVQNSVQNLIHSRQIHDSIRETRVDLAAS